MNRLFTPEQEVEVMKLYVESNDIAFTAAFIGIRKDRVRDIIGRHLAYKKEIKDLAEKPIEEWDNKYRKPPKISRNERRRGSYRAKKASYSFKQSGVSN